MRVRVLREATLQVILKGSEGNNSLEFQLPGVGYFCPLSISGRGEGEQRQTKQSTAWNSKIQLQVSHPIMGGNTDWKFTKSKGSVCGPASSKCWLWISLNQHEDRASKAGEYYHLVASQLAREAGTGPFVRSGLGSPFFGGSHSIGTRCQHWEDRPHSGFHWLATSTGKLWEHVCPTEERFLPRWHPKFQIHHGRKLPEWLSLDSELIFQLPHMVERWVSV